MTEIDQIIDGVIAPEVPSSLTRESTTLVSNETENLRERLILVAVAGKSKEYLGKSITSDEIGSLDQKELRKLYALEPNTYECPIRTIRTYWAEILIFD